MSQQTEIKVVQGDKQYDLNFTLQQSDGTAIDLTGATLVLNVQRPGTTDVKFSGNMNIVSAAAGTCKYVVANGDFDEKGSYYAEIKITFGSGQILTIPNILIKAIAGLPRE